MIPGTTGMRLWKVRNSIWAAGSHFCGVVTKTEVSGPLKETIGFIARRPVLIIAFGFILRDRTLTIAHRKK